MAKYTPYTLQINLHDRLLLCLAYYPPKSDWQGGTCLVCAGQDPVGIHVPQDKPNRHDSAVYRAVAFSEEQALLSR